MKKRRFLLSLVFQFAMAIVALADSAAVKSSYVIELPKSNRVFVMIGDDYTLMSPSDELRSQEVAIRRRFSRSGMYDTSDNDRLLWTVEGYSYHVFLSSDTNYLVKLNDWPSKSSDEVLAFFNKDSRLRSYSMEDLVDFSCLLPHSVSHFVWHKEGLLDDVNSTLTVRTRLYDKFVFDIRTGDFGAGH
jgi:hypothetical protein